MNKFSPIEEICLTLYNVQNTEKDALVILFLLAVAFFLQLVYVAVNADLVEYSYKTGEIENQRQLLKRENATIRSEVLGYSALTTIAKEAREQGFVRASFLYMY